MLELDIKITKKYGIDTYVKVEENNKLLINNTESIYID